MSLLALIGFLQNTILNYIYFQWISFELKILQSLESDIYVPMWWVDLSFNSRVILDTFLFPNWKLQNHPKNLWLNCHLIWYSTCFKYYSYQRLFSIWIQKCSVSKQEKNQGLPLSWNSNQVNSTQHFGT